MGGERGRPGTATRPQFYPRLRPPSALRVRPGPPTRPRPFPGAGECGLAKCRGLVSPGGMPATRVHPRIAQLLVLYHCGQMQLVSLDLRGTKITDAGLANLPRLYRLEALDLGDTKITDAAFGALGRIARLTNLEVDGTLITSAGRCNITLTRMPVPTFVGQAVK